MIHDARDRLTRDQRGILWSLWNSGPMPVMAFKGNALIGVLSSGLVNVSNGEARIAGTAEAWAIAKALPPPLSLVADSKDECVVCGEPDDMERAGEKVCVECREVTP